MRRTGSSLQPTFLILWIFAVLMLATAASAGHWEVLYDLAPGSNLQTVNPGGVFNDPVTGTPEIHYDAASTGAPLTGARLMAGQIDNTINQPAGVLTVTGANQNTLIPGAEGTPGTLSGVALQFSVVANHSVSGNLRTIALIPSEPVPGVYTFGSPSYEGQVIFELCSECHTIHVSNQCT